MKKLINILFVLLLPVMGLAAPTHVSMVSSHHRSYVGVKHKIKKHHRMSSFSLNRFSVDLALGGVTNMGDLNNSQMKVNNALFGGVNAGYYFNISNKRNLAISLAPKIGFYYNGQMQRTKGKKEKTNFLTLPIYAEIQANFHKVLAAFDIGGSINFDRGTGDDKNHTRDSAYIGGLVGYDVIKHMALGVQVHGYLYPKSSEMLQKNRVTVAAFLRGYL